MGKLEFTLPAMGEGIIEATVTRWFVKVGSHVRLEDPLVEVATDKVDSEIPSPVTGVVSKIIYHEGEIPKVGEVLAIIETEGNDALNTDAYDAGYSEVINHEPAFVSEAESETNSVNATPVQVGFNNHSDGPILTPLIKFLAKNREISVEELKKIKGTGLNGRIIKQDMHSYILAGRPYRTDSTVEDTTASGSIEVPDKSASNEYIPADNEEVVPMDRTRKLIAEHMVRSKRTSPHVTSMVEIDVTPLVQWREKSKAEFIEKYGVKLTYTPVIVHAVVKALKLFPGINISVIGDKIIRKKYINIGVATALPDGNLVVPVIRDADKRSFANLAIQLNDLATRSRQSKLLPAEIKGGTFTITNMGQYDNISGTPIINQPEVAILAVGAIKKKPAVVRIGTEYNIGIRDIMILSLTYDHRVVDGSLGGSFVRAIGKILEEEMPEF
jgi:2-oxoglutarate dehydrogenase E2 component (dihydrolipoamide succinyltransferase)